jgi:hypothetical protein
MRLLASNTMLIFVIGFVFASAILDLYSSPQTSKVEVLTGLEAECKSTTAKYYGLLTKEAVDNLYRIDLTIRELTRLSDFIINTLPLNVVSGRVDLGNRLYISLGIRIVFPTQLIYVDPNNYEDPLQLKAFRFSRNFEGLDGSENH